MTLFFFSSPGIRIQKLITLIAVCWLTSLQPVHAQDVSTIIPTRFIQYAKENRHEKMFVHTDKGFYLAGEILWFKIYTVDAGDLHPTDQSKIAYVEILDRENKPVMQAKIPLKTGRGNGSFYLPVSINSGSYRLRAYTNWMKNFGVEGYFEKPVTIVNSLKTLTTAPKKDTGIRYYAGFFPEGGNLVTDAESKVAFEFTDQYGKGVDGKGVLLTESNDTVLHFQSLRLGMGHFLFTPAAAHRYKALITLANGRTILQELPAAYEQGYVMQLHEAGDGTVNITVTAKGVAAQSVFLFVHARQEVQVAQQQSLNNGAAAFSINRSKLADGLSNITIFNELQQPVCERLYFKKPAQPLQVTASSNAAKYGLRKRVGLQLQTTVANATGGTPANVSLAVYRVDSLQTIDANSIGSYLWLTADLKGNIESPEYYFSSTDDAVKEATDNLLLVHGWRRFNWSEVLNKKLTGFDYVPEFDGHIITCKLTHNNEPAAAGIGCWLSVPGSLTQFNNARTDSSGKVYFDVRNYYGPNEIIVQTDAPDSTWRLDVLSPFSEKYSTTPPQAFALPEAAQAMLNEHHIGMQVVNTYDAGKLSKFNIPTIDTIPFYGKPYSMYKLDDYTRFTSMEEVLREYVPEVAIRRYGGQLHLKVFDWDAHAFYENEPLMLLDGVKINNQILLAYDPLKVNKLEVVTNMYIKGEFIYPGVVNFTTYHGDMPNLKLDARAVILDYEGLQLKREFYSPTYKTEQQALSRLPDFRNLLYWAPDIQTDAAGQAAVELYTSDVKGRYVAIVQGMDEQGHAGSYYFTFEVNDK